MLMRMRRKKRQKGMMGRRHKVRSGERYPTSTVQSRHEVFRNAHFRSERMSAYKGYVSLDIRVFCMSSSAP